MMLQNEIEKWLDNAGRIVFAGLICIPIALGAGIQTAHADEETEPLYDDSYTVGDITQDNRTEDGRIYLSRGCSYSEAEQTYYYKGSELQEDIVSANVESGDYVSYPVKIELIGNQSWKLYKDGEELENVDLSAITEPGSYSFVEVTNVSGNEKIFYFTIVGEHTTLVCADIPATSRLIRFMKDEEEMQAEGNKLSLKDEGHYEVSYQNVYTGRTNTVTTTVDRTAPVLALAEVSEDGKASGSVDISDLEEGASIEVILDGKTIRPGKVLSQSGVYDITVTDEAGNSNKYHFIILLHINNEGVVFLSLLVILAVGLIVYLVMSNKKMRVR